MNAISPCPPECRGPAADADERTAQQLHICQEIIDIGMDLIRLTARRARQAAEDRPDASPQDAASAGKPGKTADPILAFTRLANAVRQTVSLQARLATGPQAAPKRSRPPPKPRFKALRKAFEEGLARHPDRKTLTRDAIARVEEELAKDPNDELTDCDIIDLVCGALGVELNFALIFDETLNALSGGEPLDPPLPPSGPDPPGAA